MRKARPPSSPEFAPARVEEVELSSPLLDLGPGRTGGGEPFASVLCLVRLHGRPLGLVEAPLPPDGLDAATLAALVQSRLGEAVARHLEADGLPPAAIGVGGVGGGAAPPCAATRTALLERAPTVSVVIVTRGRPERVLRTARSIAAGRYPHDRYELLVVDTPEAGMAPLDFGPGAWPEDGPPLRVLVEPEPGISRARNAGLRAAQGDLVAFADDDVDVDRDWLVSLAAGFELGERVEAVSGPTLPSVVETPAERWFQGFGGLLPGFETRVYELDQPPADQPLFPWVPGLLGSGRSMAFRRDRLLELDGFDPALGPPTPTLAGEDIELLLRVLLAGGQVVHEPAALVRHAHPREYELLRRRSWGYGLGLGACLTRTALANPRQLPGLLRRLPRGIAFALSQGSAKNADRQGDYPAELVWLERAGLACGPLAYARSRRQQRRAGKRGEAASALPRQGEPSCAP